MPAMATLLLLTLQLRLQRKQVDLQRQVNEHDYDLAYVQQARADLEFYIQELNGALRVPLPYGNTVREVLLDRFRPQAQSALADPNLVSLAVELDGAEPRCIAIWFGVYQALSGLASGTGPQFEVNKHAAPIKLVATLSHDVCVALDNFHYVRTSGYLPGEYKFSKLLFAEA
jgi:hypothetical protein